MASSSSSAPGQKFLYFSLDEIKDATNNFSRKNFLGKGGEGAVYMGEIRVGWKMTQVAVKRLSKPEYSEGFEREIEIVSKFQHPNLVSLLGCCDESGEKILLYEYMEKGSLSTYIKEKSSICLSWVQRLCICLDAASGLQHIHAGTDEFPKGIIHRDVKPDNILLDKNLVAKISDFGILKLSHVGQMQSSMTTALKGTRRYLAPEYVMNHRITRAADVYAFGVVLFQVLCLTIPWDRGDESYYIKEDEDLGIWAQQNVDSKIKGQICDESLMAFTTIVGKCLKKDHHKRLTMDGVVLGLENALRLQLLEDEAEQLQGARKSSARESEGFIPELSRFARQISSDHISLDEIKQATNNFEKEKIIGQGELATVYRAEMNLGGKMTQVAVKCFKPEYSKHFEREIKMISKSQDYRLVSLLGYCNESGHKIVLSELMLGSLSSYLQMNNYIPFSWKHRILICLDVALGLQYLHAKTDEYPNGIIHRNVNPSNILLDGHWDAKISGFEFEKFSHIGRTQSDMITDLKGTREFIAPEYLLYGSVTRKIDVFAFGMVLSKLLCLKLPCDDGIYYNNDLKHWAKKNVDPQIQKQIGNDSLKVFTAIIEKCMEMDPRKRPTMDEVVSDLKNVRKCQRLHDKNFLQRRKRFFQLLPGFTKDSRLN